MGSPTNVEENITQIPMKGVEEYRWFYETKLGEILQDYREGKLKKEKASEAIASLCIGKRTYQLFHVVDVWKDGTPIDRKVFRSDGTMEKLLSEAKRRGWALLYRGMFFIPEEVWKEYRGNYATANRLEVFKLDRLTQVAPHILIDIDKDSFENLKRVVKYLHKLGIYPEVWESASGEGSYHVYIHLAGQVWRKVEKKEEGEDVEHRWAYLPYASDYRVERSIEALKEIFSRLGVKHDSISATRAVWMEGFPNPEKGGRSSKKIWDGAVHRIDKLYEKLLPVWEGIQKKKAIKQFLAEIQPRKRVEVRGTYEVVSEEEYSNVIDYLQDNISTAFRMIDRGYTRMEAEVELRAGWTGDEKQFERAFPKFWDWVEATYKPLEVSPKKEAKPKEKRKHLHYWEHIPYIWKVLLEDGLDSSLNHIHRKTGIPKGTLSYIFRIVSKEQILQAPEEAQELLKQYQKGGDRLSEEQKKALSEKGKERFRKYMEKFLEEASKRPSKPKRDNEKKPIYSDYIGYYNLKGIRIKIKGVQIGSISITTSGIRKEGDGVCELGRVGSKDRVSMSNGVDGSPNPPAEPNQPAHPVDHTTPTNHRNKTSRTVSQSEGKQAGRKKAELLGRVVSLRRRVEESWKREFGELPTFNYLKLMFGAVGSERWEYDLFSGVKPAGRTYDLRMLGKWAFALGEVLEELGHRVIYPKTSTSSMSFSFRLEQESEIPTAEQVVEQEQEDGQEDRQEDRLWQELEETEEGQWGGQEEECEETDVGQDLPDLYDEDDEVPF